MAHHHHPSHGHHFKHDEPVDAKPLGRAFLLISSFMVIELVAGLWTNALVLIADAGHMFLDAAALGLAWWAAKIAARGADQKRSYGYHRVQVLAAFINGITLAGLIIGLSIEAVARLLTPEPMMAIPTLLIATAGFVVNVIAFRLLHSATDNSNVRSAALHVLGDLLGSAVAMTAAVAVYFFGWLYADPILTLLIVVILTRGAYRVIKESTHILLEGVPRGVDLAAIRTTLADQVAGVQQIHHVHVWGLTEEKPLVTLHALVEEHASLQTVMTEIKAVLRDTFNIEHSTVQIEHGQCPDD
jgi:cobalt-zinc-cadmium efflux system protein